jgi:transcriptional regulator GlxA family with amidase domain
VVPVRERLIVLVGFDRMELLDVVGPASVFNAASRLLVGEELAQLARAGSLAASDAGSRDCGGYRLLMASADGRGFSGDCGLRVAADCSLGDLDAEGIDTLLVGGGTFTREMLADEDLTVSLRRLAPGARRVCSVCSGAFLLAAAGLLDGRCATTHWAGCTELARLFPLVDVEPDRIFVRDGRVTTSAGVTAGMDLALALVEQDHGSELARAVARWMVMFMQRPGGQAQFSERLNVAVPAGSPVRALIDEIVADPAGDHRVPSLAARSSMSERHLARVFVEQTLTTPGRFVERVRVEAARSALESSPMTIDGVATLCGFGSTETMRRAFARILGVCPAEYRERFQSTSKHNAGERSAA